MTRCGAGKPSDGQSRASPPGPLTEAPGLERIEARSDLGRALAGLSDEEREAVALRYGGDLTVREVARITGVKLSTAEGRVYRGLGKLRDLLEG